MHIFVLVDIIVFVAVTSGVAPGIRLPKSVVMCYFIAIDNTFVMYVFASMAEWSIAGDCKSPGFILRRFKSYSAHKNKKHPA